MSTQSVIPQLEEQKLCDRITLFFRLLNEKKWDECFDLIDPVLRSNGDIKLENYCRSLSDFFETYGPTANVEVVDLKLFLHDDRDFAYGAATWDDRTHVPHKSQERWVRADDGRWYSRKVGMV